MNSVTLTNFRGIKSITLPLARVTMLTGSNGTGKTSILEGLYCLFSETRLNDSPFTRYRRSIAISNPLTGTYMGYDHDANMIIRPLFWEELPRYGKSSCSVSARYNEVLWEWNYQKANSFSDVPPELLTEINQPNWNYNMQSAYAIWEWKIGDGMDSKQKKAMPLAPYGVPMSQVENKSRSFCRYIDFANTRAVPAKLTFQLSKMLAEALRLINPHVTDVRFEGADVGLSVVLNDEISVSLDNLGNGATTLANVLIVILEKLETQTQMPDTPFFVLIDEMGAAMHLDVMMDVWKYLKALVEKHPNMYFVTTSHSSDCIRAFQEVFKDKMYINQDNAKLLRLDKDGEEISVVECES